MALNVMHGLLSSGFYDRLLDEKVVNLPVQPFGRFYSCGRGECHHPVPKLRLPPIPERVEDSQHEAIERKLMDSYTSKTVIILRQRVYLPELLDSTLQSVTMTISKVHIPSPRPVPC